MLEVNALTVRFPTAGGITEAVKESTFTLQKGETIGIVGESGSGKSVTSLAIMRLYEPGLAQISGQILLDGVDLLSLSEPEMRRLRGNRIAMIFQEPMTSLNPVMTCGAQVSEAIRAHLPLTRKQAREKTIRLFEEVQLPRPGTLFESFPHQLSGGQKQRVMIAMALACDPEILIADEPTTALDVTVQKTILELLQKLKTERHMSLLFISHDLGVVSGIADRVLVMYKGQVVEDSDTEQIFSAPAHPYTRGLLACRPRPDQHLRRLPVVADFLESGAIPRSVDDIRSRFEIPPAELAGRREDLYNHAALLCVRQLSTWFPLGGGWLSPPKGFLKAVDQVSFDVYPGETLGLVGESGCGKSTLARSILRLQEPTSGEIEFGGRQLTQLNRSEMRRIRRDIQIIFQDPYSSLNPRLTIGEALMEPLEVHQLYGGTAARRKRVMELLDRVNLPAVSFNRYPHEFSGGQRQRVVIARALVLQPKFIICDESVSALDVSVQAQVLNLLGDLQEEFNLTYLFISHDLSVIKHISDRVMVMSKGAIIETGPADEIYYHPKMPYTKKLIDSIPGN